MILIIPTNDGLMLSPDPGKADTYRLLEISNGSVSDDRLVSKGQRSFSEFLSGLPASRSEITVMTTDIINNSQPETGSRACEYIATRERFITNVIIEYLKKYSPSESDYCCSP